MRKSLLKCTECGLCCISWQWQDVYCNIREEDVAKIPKRHRGQIKYMGAFDHLCSVIDGGFACPAAIKTRTVKPRTGPLKEIELCACALLRGTPLKKVWCAVYEQRPSTCHEAMRQGEPACRSLIKMVNQEFVKNG